MQLFLIFLNTQSLPSLPAICEGIFDSFTTLCDCIDNFKVIFLTSQRFFSAAVRLRWKDKYRVLCPSRGYVTWYFCVTRASGCWRFPQLGCKYEEVLVCTASGCWCFPELGCKHEEVLVCYYSKRESCSPWQELGVENTSWMMAHPHACTGRTGSEQSRVMFATVHRIWRQ